jgi:predicted amidohydrolase YtcJ
MTAAPDLILHRGLFTTLDRTNPTATAVAIKDGIFTAVGHDQEVMKLAGPSTKVIDLRGRRVLPGLIDNHLHIIRGGLNFNMELRWDGVWSLADAMAMLKKQVAVTPPPQWVRVVGGFTEHQFVEKRLPTIDELNAAAPDTPVFILHLYDRAILNAAALRAVGYSKDTPEPPGGEIVRDAKGNPTGLLLARPNANILYATLAKGPKLPFEYQVNSTRHFMRELNRLGVTGAIDAGGGFQNYPEDYAVIQKLSDEGQLTVRLAYNLFTQKPKGEKQDFLNWTSTSKYKQGTDYFRHNGAGEMLVFSAADFEDFRVARPDMPPEMESELEDVVRILVQNKWPWRLHATYDETISRALDVFEKVNQDTPLEGLHWFFDHAETISDQSIDRIAALGGGIAVQHRMAYQGEYFVERYGIGAAEATPPVKKILDKGVKVSAGTDATRVARKRHLVLERGRQERPHPGGAARRPDRAGPRLLLLCRKRDCGHDERPHGGRRTHRLRRRRLHGARRNRAPACNAELVACPRLRRIRQLGGCGRKGAGGEGACHAGLRLRQYLRCARPRSCPRLVRQASSCGPEELLGRARLRLLGGLK